MFTTSQPFHNTRLPEGSPSQPLGGQSGSALLITLMVLMALTLMGIIATQTSITEEKIASSDKAHKMAFYAADGATELASELLEQNIDSIGFDSSTPGFDSVNSIMGSLIHVNTLSLWTNGMNLATTPSDTNRDFYLPEGYAAGEPHTNFTVGGKPVLSEGAATPDAAGYEGLGKGSAHGGVQNVYDIIAQRVGSNNSESIVRVKWRHVD